MFPSTHVFNQYYFELLKKLRDRARVKKYESRDARHILKAVKSNYQTYDKSSDEYRAWFESVNQGLGEGQEPLIYKDVKHSDIITVFDAAALDHFVSILRLFMVSTISADDVATSVKALRALNNKADFDEAVSKVSDKSVIDSLNSIFEKHTTNKAAASSASMDDTMKRIEGTSLGKLAKEIMSEINMDELQKTVEDGDILKSLSNPEGSLTKVLSTVSAKMISKMAAGELQQESLLQDAMKLASELGVGGPGGSGGGLGDISAMMKQMQKMGLGGMGGGLGGRPKARHVKRKMKPNKPQAATAKPKAQTAQQSE